MFNKEFITKVLTIQKKLLNLVICLDIWNLQWHKNQLCFCAYIFSKEIEVNKPMEVIRKVESGMIAAAKDKDKLRLSTLRLIKSALHNKKIDLRKNLNEEESLQVLSSMVKQGRDSIEQFKNGGRLDLVEKEEKELKIVQEFMPEQLSEEEIEAEISKAIDEAGATSIRDMGKVMKVLMPKFTGKADGKLVGEKVKAKLSS